MSEPIRVDVWADIACPWCYIGKRRLEAGIARFTGRDVVVRHHSFQLDPTMPDDFEGGAAEYLARHKGIPQDRARAMQAHVTSVAAHEGLTYDFGSQRPANTHRAHQLVHLAAEHGVQDAVVEALYRAHFVEGRHVGHTDELVAIASDAGIDPATASEALAAGSYAAAVDDDIALAARLGVTGVPFFVFDGRLAVAGAQPPETFVRAFEEITNSAA